MQNFDTEKMREKKLSTQIYLMTEEKVRKSSTKDFLKTYNYYVNKLLLAKVDPFIEKQNRNYLRQFDF